MLASAHTWLGEHGLIEGSSHHIGPLGRRTVKAEPLPGSRVTVTSPPNKRASVRAMARPRLVPPKRCAVEAACLTLAKCSTALSGLSHDSFRLYCPPALADHLVGAHQHVGGNRQPKPRRRLD